MTTTVNYQELKDLYNSDPKVKALFDHYSTRLRGRQDSTTPRMRRVLKEKGVDMSTAELSDFYRKMQRVGVGRCIAGRRGKVSRFVWGFHLKSVAEAAKGSTQALAAPPKPRYGLPKLRAGRRPSVKATPIAAAQTAEPAQISAKDTVQSDTSKVVIHKAGFVIELPLSMGQDEWRDVVFLINNISTAG